MNIPNHRSDYRTSKPLQLTILGGGPAGLAAGYYAKKNRLPFTIYEAISLLGGNCTTFKHKDFSFDSGAHRFHDQDADVTKETKNLLGRDLERLKVPSQIYYNNKFVDFPLSPLNLLKDLGIYTSVKAGVEVLTSKLKGKKLSESFEDFALSTYGKTIADSFLLNYSEKLWGLNYSKLAPKVAGKRLKGLNLKTFLIEAIFGKDAKVGHLDGSFYYPKTGIGIITRKLEEFCGKEHIQKKSRISRIFHDFEKVQAIEINGEKKIDVDEVISTLPLTVLLQVMEPKPVEEVLHAARDLRYRNLILIALFLNKESITENASIYFPDSDIPFTRVYEPKTGVYICLRLEKPH